MEIIGKIEIKGFLRVQDLNYGDDFTYLDDNKHFMYGCDEYNCFIINLDTGEVINDSDIIFLDRPIRRIKAKLIIED